MTRLTKTISQIAILGSLAIAPAYAQMNSHSGHNMANMIQMRQSHMVEAVATVTAVMAEFDPGDEITSMRPLLREYVEGLGDVHDKLRTALKTTYTEDAERFRKSIELYKLANPDSIVGLGIAQFNEKNEVILNVPIFEELVTRVKTLQTRNGSMKNFTKRYVTSDE